MPSVARKGDIHSCPLHGIGTITDGSPTTTAEGKPVARVGDTITCADGSTAVILPNNACVSVDGKRIARIGDLTSHGGMITSGADTVTVEDGEIQVLMGKDLAPIQDGKFRLYINSPEINIHKNMHFGKDEKGTSGKSTIIDLLLASIPLEETGAGEVMDAAAVVEALEESGIITGKIAKQMTKRGWTKETIANTQKNKFYTSKALNKATGNTATAYFNEDGSYVVVDDITKNVIQISDRTDLNWVPDPTITNPYKP